MSLLQTFQKVLGNLNMPHLVESINDKMTDEQDTEFMGNFDSSFGEQFLVTKEAYKHPDTRNKIHAGVVNSVQGKLKKLGSKFELDFTDMDIDQTIDAISNGFETHNNGLQDQIKSSSDENVTKLTGQIEEIKGKNKSLADQLDQANGNMQKMVEDHDDFKETTSLKSDVSEIIRRAKYVEDEYGVNKEAFEGRLKKNVEFKREDGKIIALDRSTGEQFKASTNRVEPLTPDEVVDNITMQLNIKPLNGNTPKTKIQAKIEPSQERKGKELRTDIADRIEAKKDITAV